MPLLAEYAITPNVFDTATFGDDDLAINCLGHLREILFNEGIIRDLCNGEWLTVFSGADRQLHRRGKEMLKKLISQGRIRKFPQALQVRPTCEAAWCHEALATHEQHHLEGIITSKEVAAQHNRNPVIASILNLSGAPWWAKRDASVRVERKIDSYLKNLELFFSCSNHIMFIDANLDPTQANYRDFKALLSAVTDQDPPPRIEIHRTISEGSGRNRTILTTEEWTKRFRDEFLTFAGGDIDIEVFLWDELHDRYLISNITGINLPYGFDTSRKENDMTTWTRLGRDVRDDLMREFDPACHRHKCQGRFRI